MVDRSLGKLPIFLFSCICYWLLSSLFNAAEIGLVREVGFWLRRLLALALVLVTLLAVALVTEELDAGVEAFAVVGLITAAVLILYTVSSPFSFPESMSLVFIFSLII